MKKAIFMLLCLIVAQYSFAQKGQIGDTRWSMGVSWDILDQFTPELDGGQTFKVPMDMGVHVFTWANINSSLAIELGVSTNGIRYQSIDPPLNEKNLHLFIFDGGIVYKFNNGYILKETSPVAPFLFAKARGTYMDLLKPGESGQGMGFGIPLGGGFNWRVGDDVALMTAVSYTFGITDNFDNNLLYQIGFMFDLGTEKVQEVVVEPEPDSDNDGVVDIYDDCPQVPGPPEYNGCPDTDGDGIIDVDDDCPLEAGPAEFNGCPDRDGDGIRDLDDACPDEPGLPELNGCPNPDTDGDGVFDKDDDCPNIPGPAALRGCPDTDGDNVRDIDDACPTEPGPASNRGCPELEEEVIKELDFAAQNLQFEFGSAVIRTGSHTILDEVAEILEEWKNYHVRVEGHTDSVGSEESNQVLSEKRAQAATAYLISKGISADRISHTGYGESKPKTSNDTAEGRAQNRRVEFNLFIP
jgi:outer membrane protein OmpA-like peptidoglycan-associated protein